MTTKFSPVFIFFILLSKFIKKDIIKTLSLKLLKGLSKEVLEKYGTSFYKEVLQQKEITPTQQLLQTLREENVEIQLLSASIAPVIKAIAFQLKTSYHCSSLNYSNDIFEGTLKADLTGIKQDYISTEDNNRLIVVSDNFTDKSLMGIANERYVVVYSEQAKLFWKNLNPIFIELTSKH